MFQQGRGKAIRGASREHLDGLGIETTITAAEPCAIGTWERVDGGYRILDWEAVEYAIDGVASAEARTPIVGLRGYAPPSFNGRRQHGTRKPRVRRVVRGFRSSTPEAPSCGFET
jgi:hypothetical protein